MQPRIWHVTMYNFGVCLSRFIFPVTRFNTVFSKYVKGFENSELRVLLVLLLSFFFLYGNPSAISVGESCVCIEMRAAPQAMGNI